MTKFHIKLQDTLLETIKILRTVQSEYKKYSVTNTKVIWANSGLVSFFFNACSAITFYPQLLMYNSQEFLKNANLVESVYEIPHDLCSDNKIAISRCLSPDNSSITVPEPDILIAANLLCTQVMSGFNFIAHYKDTPYLSLDVPFIDFNLLLGDPTYLDRHLNYLSTQWHHIQTFICNQFNTAFNEKKFKKSVLDYCQSVFVFEELIKLTSHLPSPIDAQDLIAYVMPMFIRNEPFGNYNIVDLYCKVYNALNEIIKENEKTNASKERIRLYWDGPLFIHKRRLLKKVLDHYHASIVGGSFELSYCHSIHSPKIEVEQLQPKQLSEYMQESNFMQNRFYINNIDSLNVSEIMARLTLHLSFFKHGLSHRKTTTKKLIKYLNIDAAIIHMNQNCKFWSLMQIPIHSYIKNTLSIPTLTIQADHLDERAISESQLINRIEAFLEQQ